MRKFRNIDDNVIAYDATGLSGRAGIGHSEVHMNNSGQGLYGIENRLDVHVLE